MPVSGINTPDWAVMPTSFWRIVRIRTDFTFNGLSQLNSYFNDCITVNRDTQFYLNCWENIQKLWKVSIYGYFTIMIVLIVPVVFIFSSVEGQGYPDWLLDSTDFRSVLRIPAWRMEHARSNLFLDHYIDDNWIWRLFSKLQPRRFKIIFYTIL